MDFAAHAADVWSHQVRFIGAGAIGISSIWTLVTLARPVVGGLMTTLAAARGAAAADERDRDLPSALDLRAHGRVPGDRRVARLRVSARHAAREPAR